jgi:surfeit locus 1 family protein
MKGRFPVFATLLVLCALAVMIRLGFWQLDRLHQKEAMLANYAAAQADQSIHDWPKAGGAKPAGYTRVRFHCDRTVAQEGVSGRNALGRPGWAHVSLCEVAGAQRVRVTLGWSERPDSVVWRGGEVVGTFVPHEGANLQVVADPPLAGLAANAKPDPREIPNNHLSYAVQWFLFAATALVIYLLALRKRWRGQ